jgi:hypothetical protein
MPENKLSCACTRAQCLILVPDVSECVLDIPGPICRRPIFVDSKIAATMLADALDSCFSNIPKRNAQMIPPQGFQGAKYTLKGARIGGSKPLVDSFNGS